MTLRALVLAVTVSGCATTRAVEVAAADDQRASLIVEREALRAAVASSPPPTDDPQCQTPLAKTVHSPAALLLMPMLVPISIGNEVCAKQRAVAVGRLKRLAEIRRELQRLDEAANAAPAVALASLEGD